LYEAFLLFVNFPQSGNKINVLGRNGLRFVVKFVSSPQYQENRYGDVGSDGDGDVIIDFQMEK
jgi:hypothetical protein